MKKTKRDRRHVNARRKERGIQARDRERRDRRWRDTGAKNQEIIVENFFLERQVSEERYKRERQVTRSRNNRKLFHVH